jgi:hypothetical protein
VYNEGTSNIYSQTDGKNETSSCLGKALNPWLRYLNVRNQFQIPLFRHLPIRFLSLECRIDIEALLILCRASDLRRSYHFYSALKAGKTACRKKQMKQKPNINRTDPGGGLPQLKYYQSYNHCILMSLLLVLKRKQLSWHF